MFFWLFQVYSTVPYGTHNLRFGAFQIGCSIINHPAKKGYPHNIWEPSVEPYMSIATLGNHPIKLHHTPAKAQSQRFLMPWELCNATVMYSDGNGLAGIRTKPIWVLKLQKICLSLPIGFMRLITYQYIGFMCFKP